MLSKKDAIRYVINHPTGDVAQLENVIGTERLKEFEYLGYIKNGISHNRETYGIAGTIRKDYHCFYEKPSFFAVLPSIIFGGMAKLFS